MTVSSLRSSATADGHVRRLMFLTSARDPAECTPKVLADLEEKRQDLNFRLGVGGFLLYSAPYFFEVLEGFSEVIGPVFEVIRRDSLRDRCIVLGDVHCTERLYADWRMRVVDAAELPVTVDNVLRQTAGAFLSMWRYLPRSAADLLLQGKDPRQHPPRSQEVVVSFVRIVEFDSIQAQPKLVRHLADILEVFVGTCIRHTTETGGEFAKFVNGVVMLFWPGQHALQAYKGLCAILDSFAHLRRQQPPTSALSLCYVRAGVHHGRALLCNAGLRKADFTLLGDAVNVAARLCSKAVQLNAGLLLSSAMRHAIGAAGQQLVFMGPQHLKGRREPLECYRSPGTLVDGDAVRRQVEQFVVDGRVVVPPLRPVALYDDLPPVDQPGIFEDLLHQPRGVRPPARLAVRPPLLRCCVPWPRPAYRVDPAGPPLGLIRLLYLSRASAPLSAANLENICKASTKRNRVDHITSELIYLNDLLLHSVEGPIKAVGDLWQRLQSDTRHRDLVLIHLAPIQTRMCLRPMDIHPMAGAALDALPILPELLSHMARSFSCLETYVPHAVVRHIMAEKQPMRMPPILVTVVMMATDIVSFTPLSEGCPLTEVWHLCTTFIDLCTEEIHRNRGYVLKLVGDCVKAYFPADAAPLALEAAKGITHACQQFRQKVHRLDCRSVMACGVGLDCGPVVMAHCGTPDVAKLLVTGEAASRVMEVEALSRKVGRKIIVTQPLADRLPAGYPLERLKETPGVDGTPCYALAGADRQLDCGHTLLKTTHFPRSGRVPLEENHCAPAFHSPPGAWNGLALPGAARHLRGRPAPAHSPAAGGSQ
eukprot:EG_transcript_3256